MKKTHDGLDVYPIGSSLPFGALGWTQCRLYGEGSAYESWIDEKDLPKYNAHLDVVRKSVEVITTKKLGLDTMNKLGISTIGITRLKDMKLRIEDYYVEKCWPLIECVARSN